MHSDRSVLPIEEREAVAREIEKLMASYPNQTELAQRLGMSQQTISAAKNYRSVGPVLARKVEVLLQTTVADLVAKHGLTRTGVADLDPLEVAIAYLGNLVGPEAAARVRARKGPRHLTPREWGHELLEEQREVGQESAHVIQTTGPVGVPQPSPASSVPGSQRRRRKA